LDTRIIFLAICVLLGFSIILTINDVFADILSWDKPTYKIGDTALFGAIINEANTDPISIESILIHLSSDSDPIGIDIISFETENDSGIFVATIKFASFTGSTTIKVSEGDSVYAKYGNLSDTTTIEVSRTFTTQNEEPPIIIPGWIKDIAAWWANDQIDDEAFVEGIQFLIREEVIIIPPTGVSNTGEIEIPVWVKNNAKWWSDGLISNEEFVKGIQFLVQEGIIVI